MPRPPLPVGTFGRIGFLTLPGGRVRARAQFRDYDGVTRPVTRYGASRAAAERRLREALRDRMGPAAGEITPDSRLRDVAATWRAEIEDQELSDGSRQLYVRTLDRHVVKGLGGLLLREVDVPKVDRFLKSVREHHGAAAAKSAKTVTSLVLGFAVRHGALAANPVRDTGRIKSAGKTRPKALTAAETTDLLKKVDAETGADPAARASDELDLPQVVGFMLGTGMRIGETLAVRRQTVDLEAGVAEVSATVVRLTGRGVVLQERAKSDAGWRVIALPEHVTELCRSRMAMAWPRDEHGVLFPTELGELRNPSIVARGLKTVLGRLGEYEWVTSHTFRKTVATRLDEAGLSARAIADHLGHAKPSMTQDVYMGRGVASAAAAEALRGEGR